MTNSSTKSKTPSKLKTTEIVRHLNKILSSKIFLKSQRCASFLKFVVEETLAGRSDQIKASFVANQLFHRNGHINSDEHTIVRVYAGRVRKKLEQYYKSEDFADRVRIVLPIGSYVPTFELNQMADKDDTSVDAKPLLQRLPRIAVLPLVNLSGSAEHQIFIDGLSEQLSSQLARFQQLKVLDYWTTSQFLGEPLELQKVCREFNIDFFITGSVARSGDLIRINIQCADTCVSEQIWGQQFERQLSLDNLFDIQDEIIEQVVARIGDAYGSIPQRLFLASRGKPRHDLSVYEAMLAYYYYERNLDQTAHDSMLAMFESAIAVEPLYAMGWAILSTLYSLTVDSNPSAPAGLLDRAEDFAQRAILLDPNCQQAYSSLAHIGVLTRDYPCITMACNKIFQLNPHAAYMVGTASVWLAIAGQFDQAIQFLEHSRQLNPLYPGWFNAVYWLQAFTNQDYERTLWAARQFNMPLFFWDPLARAISYGKLGHRQPAAKAYEELLKLLPDFSVQPRFYLSCYIHSEEILTDMLKSLKVAGMTARQER